jgi:hypothetical protein
MTCLKTTSDTVPLQSIIIIQNDHWVGLGSSKTLVGWVKGWVKGMGHPYDDHIKWPLVGPGLSSWPLASSFLFWAIN